MNNTDQVSATETVIPKHPTEGTTMGIESFPTPEELVSWCRQNGFKLIQASFGDRPSCGCALSALVCMKFGPQKLAQVVSGGIMDGLPELLGISEDDGWEIAAGYDNPTLPPTNPFHDYGHRVAELLFS